MEGLVSTLFREMLLCSALQGIAQTRRRFHLNADALVNYATGN